MMTYIFGEISVSTHMPLARHDSDVVISTTLPGVSTHMPLARHDPRYGLFGSDSLVSTHMPLARHDDIELALCMLDEFLLTCLLRGMTCE